MLRRPLPVLVAVVVSAPVLSTCASQQLAYTDGFLLIPTDTGTTFRGNPVPVECPAGTHGGGVNPHVAEFDDCQRLTLGASQFSALIGVRALARTTTADVTPFDQPFGAAVAQLYNFSSFQFGPLSIRPKYSCVYLRRQSGEWRGRIVSLDEQTTCPAPSSATWADSTFRAVRDTTGSTSPADYPAVARWEWTPAAGNGAIGVHCGAGWCEIGPAAGAEPSSPGTVKGWSDEQLLAEEIGGGLVPRVPATITPVTRLDTLQQSDFTCDSLCPVSAAWVHVATVVLETASDYYKRKMNFDVGAEGNRIYLRYKPALPEGRRWQTRIISVGRDTSYHVTNYMPQPAGQVPPVARFRWRSDDDTTWIRCSLGCCEGTGARISVEEL